MATYSVAIALEQLHIRCNQIVIISIKYLVCSSLHLKVKFYLPAESSIHHHLSEILSSQNDISDLATIGSTWRIGMDAMKVMASCQMSCNLLLFHHRSLGRPSGKTGTRSSVFMGKTFDCSTGWLKSTLKLSLSSSKSGGTSSSSLDMSS